MEHLHHFQLGHDPFQNEPDPRFLVETGSFIEARRRVDRALRQSKGLVVLTGAAGVGKTILARSIWESLEEELFESHLTVIMPGVADANHVLRRFAVQLGVDEPPAERGDLIPQLYDQLAAIREEGRQCVFVIDDAHILSAEALAELAGLLQLEYEGKRLFSMLLVGLPELDSALSEHAVTGHRVDVRTRLEPLDPADISRYLAHRIQVAGGKPPILTPEAVSALGKLGRGRPRLLNTLADNALFEAYLAGRPAVAAYDVERAATDLGIGPDPGDTFVAPMPASRRARPAAPHEADVPVAVPVAFDPPVATSAANTAQRTPPVAAMAPPAAAPAPMPVASPPAPQAAPAAAPGTGLHTPIVMAAPEEPVLDAVTAEPEAQHGDKVDNLFAELLED